jgi:hypothetical protein
VNPSARPTIRLTRQLGGLIKRQVEPRTADNAIPIDVNNLVTASVVGTDPSATLVQGHAFSG